LRIRLTHPLQHHLFSEALLSAWEGRYTAILSVRSITLCAVASLSYPPRRPAVRAEHRFLRLYRRLHQDPQTSTSWLTSPMRICTARATPNASPNPRTARRCHCR